MRPVTYILYIFGILALLKAISGMKNTTWDKVTDQRIATLHPNIRAFVTESINIAQKKYGRTYRITDALRTRQQQQDLYNQGRTTPGLIVTNAKPGQTFHNYGLAFDYVEIVNGVPQWNDAKSFKVLADIVRRKSGWKWGGDFTNLSDPGHLEYNPLGLSAWSYNGKTGPGTVYPRLTTV